jgi:hypothetical protein
MTPMMNICDAIRANLHFNKFAVGGAALVEYKCPIEQEVFKKGAAVLYQDFKDDFCVLVFFVSDNFIRDVAVI